tara:strand:- start:16917 stop:17408 length:492 start_codon:yes stop_codon:yes gene_type:complete
VKAIGKLFVFGAIIGGGAYIYQYITLITKLVYNVTNLNLKYFSLTNTEVNADLIVENKGYFTAKIYKVEVDIYIEEKFMGKLNKTEEFVLKPASISVIPVILSINPKTFGGNIANIFENIDFSTDTNSLSNLKVKFVGKLTTKVYGIPFKIPFTYSDIIKNLK